MQARTLIDAAAPAALTLALAAAAAAGPAAGLYDPVDARDAASLRLTLHDLIDDHTRYPYTSTATDTWDILDLADEDPNNAFNVLDIYKNASYPKAGGGNPNYNREHSWPKSYGFPIDGSTNYPYTDCHHLFICDSGYNSSRNNKPYDTASASASEKPTLFNNGVGGGTGVYTGNSNWTFGSGLGAWETWVGRRGDVARALLYMDVRYEGGTHGGSGASEPDLILTDNASLIVSNTSTNRSVAYMGMLSTLLDWHAEDPPDALEHFRNDIIESYQGNRNPFIDHPEWVDCLWLGMCDVAWINELHYDNAGADTGEFVEVAARAGTDLSGWKLLGYNGANGEVYKTVNLSGVVPDEGDCRGAISFAFTGLQNGPDGVALVNAAGDVLQFISYEGSFTAVNGHAAGLTSVDIGVSENGSTPAGHALRLSGSGALGDDFSWNAPAAESPGSLNSGQTIVEGCAGSGLGGGGGAVWINEVHYDNVGADTGEFVEVAGAAGASLSGWTLILYNGSGGAPYATINLSGVLPDEGSGWGAVGFSYAGIQNGPDGVALVDASGVVVEFLSYEGSFTAVGGAANGMTSTQLPVSESGSTPAGDSLQRTGTGCGSSFTWTGPTADSFGLLNAGQTVNCP
jgi:endonuclease I